MFAILTESKLKPVKIWKLSKMWLAFIIKLCKHRLDNVNAVPSAIEVRKEPGKENLAVSTYTE